MSNTPTVAERIDSESPHYDEAFAKLRAKAFQAFDDHVEDYENDPEYRAESDRLGFKP